MNETLAIMDETIQYYYKEVMEHYMPEYIKQMEYTPWVFSLLGSALIGMAGILPLILIPDTTAADSKAKGKDTGSSPKDRKFDFLFLELENRCFSGCCN
jgi:solute carrier family 39 (zinc transporter), member 13